AGYVQHDLRHIQHLAPEALLLFRRLHFRHKRRFRLRLQILYRNRGFDQAFQLQPDIFSQYCA
ncbi:hypothetical protein, partial [Paenibacillus campinasensis]|uniref:hypothetical protein n=1 Tax=Paenibacillus campinasensis TaxID=66347 RepID=UPI001E39D773